MKKQPTKKNKREHSNSFHGRVLTNYKRFSTMPMKRLMMMIHFSVESNETLMKRGLEQLTPPYYLYVIRDNAVFIYSK